MGGGGGGGGGRGGGRGGTVKGRLGRSGGGKRKRGKFVRGRKKKLNQRRQFCREPGSSRRQLKPTNNELNYDLDSHLFYLVFFSQDQCN